MQRRFVSSVRTRLALAVASLSSLGGCALLPPPAPTLDGLFGASVRHSVAAQTANPDAGKRARQPDEFDAQSAVAALARHRATFKAPPPSFNIIGVTGGGDQQ